MKREMPEREYRTFTLDKLDIEKREDQQGVIVGHAAVFDTVDGPEWFKERVARGAFEKSITTDDVRALFNHDPNYVLGRNKAGTLNMREDDKGLWVEINPPDTQFARDLMISIERGDISQMSFGFEIIKEERTKGENGEPDLFTLQEVRLWDVSPVTYPFYKATDVSVKSRTAWSEAQRADGTPKGRPRVTKRRLNYNHKRRNV